MKQSIQLLVVTTLATFMAIRVNANAEDSIPSPPLPETESELKLGLSIKNPIVIAEIDIDKAIKIIEQCIKKNYPDYKVIYSIPSVEAKNRDIKIFTINKGDEFIMLYFDIGAAKSAFREKHKEEIELYSKDIEIIYPEPEANPEPEPGYSIQKPIIIPETDLDQADKFIRQRLKEVYPDYNVISTMRTEANKRTIDIYTIGRGDESIKLYFDVEIAMATSLEKEKE